MLGYGFTNSKIHELCLLGIINNFFNRNSIFLLDSYSIEYNNPTDEIIKSFFDIFLEEEKSIQNIDSPESQQELLYKYILTSNIIKNKNYEFHSKLLEEIILDGKNNLFDIFKKSFTDYLSPDSFEETNKFLNDWLIEIKKDSLDSSYSINFVKDKINDYLITQGFYVNILQKHGIKIYDYYDKAGFLESRKAYLNILDGQINSLI